MVVRFLILLIFLWLTQSVSSFHLIEDLKGMTRGGKSPGIPPGEVRYFAQKGSRVVALKDEVSRNAALAPPCSVIGINGKKLTVRDFYGRQEAILVEDGKDLRGVKIGDKVVVKDAVLMIGLSPQ